MNYYTFNYTNKNGEQKELRLRLTSGDAIELENTKKKGILEIVQEESMSSVISILRYLIKWENKQFSFQDAQKLYDELIDSGMSMKSVLLDVIYESLVVSGFLEKDRWEEMKKVYKKVEKKAVDQILESL